MKLLIVVPSFKILGGVSNHYEGLAPHWKAKIIYSFQGKRPHMSAYLTMIPDYISFLYKLLRYHPDAVILNPSLARHIVIRDSIYAILANLFKVPVVTFIHGWIWDYSDILKAKPNYFLRTFGKSKLFLVLYSGFRQRLKEIGIKSEVRLTTTKVADDIIDNGDSGIVRRKIKTILFLARIEPTKGIYIMLDAFNILIKKHPDLKLIICGTGTAESEVRDYAIKLTNANIEFRGKVSGKTLISAYNEADVYVLPTYREGMATTILEAMAFGLPILSRPVGGVNDFFENGRMGQLLESFAPEDYANILEQWIANPQTVSTMSDYNRQFAYRNFKASKVTGKLEAQISNVLNGQSI